MDVLEGFLGNIQRKVFADFDVYQLIRLVIIIGGYVFLRTRVSDYLKQRQLKTQIEHDRAEKDQAATDALLKSENTEPELFTEHEGVAESEKQWGWGKATRRRVAKQQQLFEQQVEKAALAAQKKLEANLDANPDYDSDDDDDIAELLQDE